MPARIGIQWLPRAIFGGNHLPMRALLLSASLIALATAASGQFNTKGRFHGAIGVGAGGHSTELDQKFKILGVTVANSETGSAGTTSLPIEVGVGLGKPISLGLGIELGRYVPDTNQTNQTNAWAVVALQPRFFIINKDRFAWSAMLQIGGAALRIKDDTRNAEVDERYSGTAFGLGSGLHFGLSDKVGIDLQLRYLATRMELRAREFNGRSTMDFYNATLSTGGFIGQLALSFRFGG